MSTRCLIGKMEKDGSVKAIYCHHDGYPAGVGKTLSDFYGDCNVDQLLALGDLSVLGANPVSDKRFWLKNDPETQSQLYSGEWCMSYRDRGEENVDAKEFADDEAYEKEMKDGWIEYAYLLCDGEWLVSEGHGFKPLDEEI